MGDVKHAVAMESDHSRIIGGIMDILYDLTGRVR